MSCYQNINIQVDTHTHTVLSGHAWSTLIENAQSASQISLKAMCCTEHAYSIPESTPSFLPSSFHMMPRNILGVKIFRGLEFNILDYEGDHDVFRPKDYQKIEFGIASMHAVIFTPGTKEQNTQAFIGALQKPHIDIIGHPGNPVYPCDILSVVNAAKKYNKMIEINNGSFSSREGARENCFTFAKLCKEKDVRICVGSDAHFADNVGRFPLALQILKEVEFPSELITNLTLERFENYLLERKARIVNQ